MHIVTDMIYYHEVINVTYFDRRKVFVYIVITLLIVEAIFRGTIEMDILLELILLNIVYELILINDYLRNHK